MLLLPANIVALLAPCASLFSRPVQRLVYMLLVRAILTEIARRKRQGFRPSRSAGCSGLSPCFWPAG